MHRETWVDFAKGIAIILVVFGHAIRGIESSGLPLHTIWFELESLIYAFHMPLFFALSGWFYIRSTSKKDFVNFAVNRIERILYPMIVWTYVFFAVKFLAGEHTNSPVDADNFPLIPIPGTLHLWFLWDLMVLNFMAYPFRFALRNNNLAPFVWLLTFLMVFILKFIPLPEVAMPWFGSAIGYAPFFLLGVVAGRTKYSLRLGTRELVALVSVCAAVLANWSYFADPELRMIGSLVLVVCFLGLLKEFGLRCPVWLRSAVVTLGYTSMTIYVSHTIFSAGLREILISLNVIGPSIQVLIGVIAGLTGPLALLAASRHFGISRLLGLEVTVVPFRKNDSHFRSK